MNSSSGRRLRGAGRRQNIMPARRVLIVVLFMFAINVHNMNTLHNMVKKQISSRWGAEQNVTQSGEGQPKLKRKSVYLCAKFGPTKDKFAKQVETHVKKVLGSGVFREEEIICYTSFPSFITEDGNIICSSWKIPCTNRVEAVGIGSGSQY